MQRTPVSRNLPYSLCLFFFWFLESLSCCGLRNYLTEAFFKKFFKWFEFFCSHPFPQRLYTHCTGDSSSYHFICRSILQSFENFSEERKTALLGFDKEHLQFGRKEVITSGSPLLHLEATTCQWSFFRRNQAWVVMVLLEEQSVSPLMTNRTLFCPFKYPSFMAEKPVLFALAHFLDRS